LNFGKNDVLVADIFSNMAFMGTTEDGLAAWPFRGEDGVYHIQGNLEIASLSLFKKNLTASLPVLDVAKAAKIVLCLPIPRYVTNSCCADPAHIANLDEDEFQAVVAGAGPAVRAVIEGELPRPTGTSPSLTLCRHLKRPTRWRRQSAALASVSGGWRTESTSPTQPTRMYTAASEPHRQLAATDGPGRRRLDSIVPTARPTPAAPIVQTPAWIKGEERPGWSEATGEAAGHAAGPEGEAEGAPGAHIRTVVINIISFNLLKLHN
jgi:hypothetical protein